MVLYTTQLLIPEVEERIDDVQYANYHIPVMQHGHRVLKPRSRDGGLGVDYTFTEDDYVDARDKPVFVKPDAAFSDVLSGQQIATLSKLNRLMRTLVDGGSVSSKALKAALTAEQYSAYLESLTAITQPCEYEYGGGMPSELRSYQRMLTAADFQHNKFEKMSALRSAGRVRYKPGVVGAAEHKAEHLYERALEHLQEIWESATPQTQYELQCWMDRRLDFDDGADRLIGIDPVTIPRMRGSRSINALDSGLPKLSKRLKRKECQLIALRDAAFKLAFVSEEATEPDFSDADRERLTQTMERLKKLMRS